MTITSLIELLNKQGIGSKQKAVKALQEMTLDDLLRLKIEIEEKIKEKVMEETK